MQKVSQSRKARLRLTRSLLLCAGAISLVVTCGVSAGGTFPAVSQSGSQSGSLLGGRSVEPAGFDRRAMHDERTSLKRALVDSSQPSGSEERKYRSREERRALILDLRNATRGLSEDGYPAD